MRYPALDVCGVDGDLALAVADDFCPSAAEPHGSGLTIFFSDSAQRDRAHDAIARNLPTATISAREVDDEDWGRRSQENLQPVTVGRLTISPVFQPPSRDFLWTDRSTVVIAPSMGFGTGHHATTRLCLLALQEMDLTGRVVLDVGTGSGILAVVAGRLGAARAVGVDNDPDAIRSAVDNLRLNPGLDNVEFQCADFRSAILPEADVAVANLTGTQIARSARTLTRAVQDGGTLILGGVLASERADVIAAFADMEFVSETQADEWVCLTFVQIARNSGLNPT